MAGNKLTRRDFAEDSIFEIGTDYAKNLEVGIEANAKLLKSFGPIKEAILSMAQASADFKKVSNSKEFLETKKAEAEASKKAGTALEEQRVAIEKQAAAYEKTRKAEIKLAQDREKAFDKFEQQSLRKEKAAERERKGELKLASDREKAFVKMDAQLKKEATARAKGRAALKKESDEYVKLDKALTLVRNRAKSVAAEMFRLEQQGKRNTTEYEKLERRSKNLARQTGILDKGIKDIDKSLGQHQREVGNYGIATERLHPALGRVNSQLGMMGTSLDALVSGGGGFKLLGQQLMNFGKATLTFLVSPVGLALAALGSLFLLIKGNKQTVIDFNDGLLNVGKTSGLAGKELESFGKSVVVLSKGLRVVSSDKLLEFSSVAGQLGVKGAENILSFAGALAKLETASNIAGEEGASQIARLLTLTDGGVENVEAFGDEIVNLGNNFAATEKEILGNATAIAQNTKLYGFGRTATLAYATATKALGVEAELTGSTIGRTFGLMEESIRTGKNIQQLAALTGIAVEDLKQALSEDSAGVFTKFTKGLNDIFVAGGSVNEQLSDFGINSIRDQKVIGSLAASYEVLDDALLAVSDSSGKMQAEFEVAAEKLKNDSASVGQAWDNLILTFEDGNGAISQSFKVLAGLTTDFLNSLTSWNTSTAALGMEVQNNLLKTQADRYKALGQEANAYAKIDAKNAETKIRQIKEEIAQAERRVKLETERSFVMKLVRGNLKEYENAVDALNLSLSTQEGLLQSANVQMEAYNKTLSEVPTGGAAQKTTISDLRTEITGLNADLELLDITDAEGIKNTKEKIATKQKELDAILGVTQATKQATKAAKEQKDYTFETNKFVNEQKIRLMGEFANDEKRDFDTRLAALQAQADLELGLNAYLLDEALKVLENERLAAIKAGEDKVAVEKSIATKKRDILIRSEAERQAIVKRFEDSTDGQALAKFTQELDTKVILAEKALNERLILENEYFEETKDQYEDLEAATKAHETRVAKIKKDAAIEALNAQIKGIEALLTLENFSAEERIRLEAKVTAAKKAASDLQTDTYVADGEKRVLTEEEINKAIIDLSVDLVNEIGNIFKNASDARIQALEAEVAASDAKYDKLLEQENLYEEDRKRIEDTKERAREDIERKIIQAKRRQALLDKALAAVQIGINTAVNISKVTPNPILIALVAALGAAQLVNVATTKIPAYEKGTDDHPGGFALVGEKRPEVIREPNKAPYVVSSATVLDLPKGTAVSPSLGEYEKLVRASILASVHSSNDKMTAFQTGQIFDLNNRDLIRKLDDVQNTIKNSKSNVNIRTPKPQDIGFEFFRFRNMNWRG